MSFSKRFIRNLLDTGRDQRTDHAADDHAREDESHRRPAGGDVLTEDALGEKDAGETATHEHFTMSKVDQSEDAVHERVAHRDHRVEGSVLQPDLEVGPERNSYCVKAAQPEVLKSHAGSLSPYEFVNVTGAGAKPRPQ